MIKEYYLSAITWKIIS